MGVTAVDAERERIAALRTKLTDTAALTLAERFRVLFALRNYDAKQYPEAVDALLTGFKDPSALFRHEIAFVLGQMQAESAVAMLTQVLENETENSMVRHEAGEALGAIASAECEEPLRKHLDDRLPEIHETCHLALERLTVMQGQAGMRTADVNSSGIVDIWSQKMKQAELNEDKTGLDSCYKSVDPAPPVETDELGSALTISQLSELMLSASEDLVRRYGAMFTLRNKGSCGDGDAISALCDGFRTDSALMRHEVRSVPNSEDRCSLVLSDPLTRPDALHILCLSGAQLAYILGQLQNSAAVDALIDRLRDSQEHPMVRHEAAEALGAIGFEGTNSLLMEFLKDPEPIVADSCEVYSEVSVHDFRTGLP